MKIKKVIQVLERKMWTCVSYINPPTYKKHYPNYLRKIGVRIPVDYYENNTGYIAPSVNFDGNDYRLISIGKNTTISMQVVVLTHDYSIVKGLQAMGLPTNKRFLKPVSIGANCFIGARSFLLPGTEIGDNCIIGAGSIVRGKIPDNSIVAGNPAKVICGIEEWIQRHIEKEDFIDT